MERSLASREEAAPACQVHRQTWREDPNPDHALRSATVETLQSHAEMLNQAPRVQAMRSLANVLQTRTAPHGIVQRVVRSDQGHPGMEVTVVATGERGLIRRLLMRDGTHIGYWVQLHVAVVGGNNGQQPFTFNQLNPVGDVQPVPQDAWMERTNAPSVIMEDGSIRRPPQFRHLAGETPADVIHAGEGVQFQDEQGLWQYGHCTDIVGDTYTVVIAGKLIQELIGSPSLKLPRDQLRTSPEIRATLGQRKTKSSKRDWSAADLATPGQEKEVAGLHSAIAPLLLRNPILFGQILRTGGHVGTEEFAKVAKGMGIQVKFPTATRGKSKNKELSNAIVANDTSAIIATRLDKLDHGAGEWMLHGKVNKRQDNATDEEQEAPLDERGEMEDIDDVHDAPAREDEDNEDHPVMSETEIRASQKSMEFDLAAFRQRFVFQQGGLTRDVVNLPKGDKRRQMHAEAKAVRSPTWSHILRQTIQEFRRPDADSGEGQKGRAGPRLPARRKIISIAINRSSCGTKKDSGHTGGCAGELAVVVAEFWAALDEQLGADYVAELRAGGRIVIEVSVGGEYEKPGQTGPLARAGANLRTHPTYDFAADMPEPLTASKYAYMKNLASVSGQKDAGGDLQALLDAMPRQLVPSRQPVLRLAARRGQHQIQGQQNPHHSGRIACTSIAAIALREMLAHAPDIHARQVTGQHLEHVMVQGTDLDRQLRNRLQGADVADKDDIVVTAHDASSRRQGTAEMPTLEDRGTSPLTGPGDLALATKPEAPSRASPGHSPIDNRYFAHDEVHGDVPGLEVHQDALDEIEPAYLHGVRGDYRRIARQLTRMLGGTGMLVTIGASTLTVANITPAQGALSLALFDSHGQAILETYGSEEGLTDALEELYPALPGVSEMNAVWYATPYRPTPQH